MLVRPVQEISQVMMKWCRRASHLGSFFCGTTAAELHNSVDLLCGTNNRRNFWTMKALEDSANTDRYKTFSKLLKYVRFTKIQQTFKRWAIYKDRIAE